MFLIAKFDVIVLSSLRSQICISLKCIRQLTVCMFKWSKRQSSRLTTARFCFCYFILYYFLCTMSCYLRCFYLLSAKLFQLKCFRFRIFLYKMACIVYINHVIPFCHEFPSLELLLMIFPK